MILLDILFPRRCAVCDAAISATEYPVCLSCKNQYKRISGATCMLCGKPLSNDTVEYCRDCKKTKRNFKQGVAAFLYTGQMKESMVRFKFGGRQEYAKFYGENIAKVLANKISHWSPEVIIPVPIHHTKRIKRGYNQAELIADEVAKCIQLPVNKEIIKRVKKTKPQKELDDKKRKRNLHQAFEVRTPIDYKRVLIIDDIFTTGSTMDEISRLLKSKGVDEVFFAVACIGLVA